MKRIVDFQDVAYGDEYIDRLEKLAALDAANGGAAKNFAFTAEAAKRLAVAMAYDDVIRVADIKLRPSRFARLREEAGAAPDQLVYATEYLHPRGEEICGMMPASLGAFIEARPLLFRALDRIVNRGRRVPVGRIGGFLQLYGVAALRPTRRSSLRHKRETEHWEAWLARASEILPKNYDLAVEVLRCRRLVKGYSDTHARGLSKFDRVMAKAPEARSARGRRRNGWRGLFRRRSWTKRARRSTASRRRSTRFNRPGRQGAHRAGARAVRGLGIDLGHRIGLPHKARNWRLLSEKRRSSGRNSIVLASLARKWPPFTLTPGR